MFCPSGFARRKRSYALAIPKTARFFENPTKPNKTEQNPKKPIRIKIRIKIQIRIRIQIRSPSGQAPAFGRMRSNTIV